MSKPDRIVITSKYGGPIGEKKFFMDIQAAIIDGYRIAENGTNKDCTMRNYLGFEGRACLYLEGKEPTKAKPVAAPVVAPKEDITPAKEKAEAPVVAPVIEPSVDADAKDEDKSDAPKVVFDAEKLNSLTKKKPLLAYAKELGIEIPSDMNIPAQIKKFIKDAQTT